MKVLVAFVVLFLVSAQVLTEEMGLSDEGDWPYNDQLQDELQGPLFENFLQRIARKPRPDQFYGLMGKRTTGGSTYGNINFYRGNRISAGLGQISRKRHKTNSFVGLMGKRTLFSGSYERNTVHNYERRRK